MEIDRVGHSFAEYGLMVLLSGMMFMGMMRLLMRA
jgi:hypothetical protein